MSNAAEPEDRDYTSRSSAPLDTVATKTVMLKNTGTGAVLRPESPFTLLGGPVAYRLSQGQTQPLAVAFSATNAGSGHESLAIAIAEPAGVPSIRITGSSR
jgi:hypothetical protein